MPPLGYHRATPAVSGVHRAVGDGRAARGTLRALALLVDRMAVVGFGRPGVTLDAASQSAVRDALRQFTARIRDAAMLCRVHDGQFVLAGEPVDRGLTRDDPLLGTLLQRCQTLGVGGITVRQGASAGELLTLASLLTQGRGTDVAPLSGDTPTTLSAVYGERLPRELLRSWSVLVTPAEAHAEQEELSDVRRGDEAAPDVGTPGGGSSAAAALSRLAASHDDLAATRAADAVVQVLDDAELRGDMRVIEGVARAVMAHLHQVGVGAGRLAAERIVRRLQHRASLELLARCLPHANDRTLLLELLSRAGETAVEVLVKQLLQADDPSARRAYFDSIVSLDLGATLLFELVRDSRWFVVRNAVALLGEMGVEQADTAMLPLLRHDDDRIRVATARALVRLGTAKALHGLHAAIDDRHPEVRRMAAVSYGLVPASGGVRPPAGRLAAALENESDEDVALEMLASLGKLGSADAIQRLLRVALPQQPNAESPDKPKDAWLRIAALEALVRARGNAVMPHVDALANDADPEVAAAAQRLRS